MTKGITITIVASLFAIVLVGLLASPNGITGAVVGIEPRGEFNIACLAPMATGAHTTRCEQMVIEPDHSLPRGATTEQHSFSVPEGSTICELIWLPSNQNENIMFGRSCVSDPDDPLPFP